MALGALAGPGEKVTRIVGIVLTRNEEFFIERAVRNATGFCDEWILCDNGSTDATPQILERLAGELPSAQLHRISHPKESHDLIRPLAGQDVWVFGLDGDEIYDPAGLGRMRERLLAGEFVSSWMLLGNVLHVTKLSDDRSTATGHLTPPCRSMTKLYNFSAIESWDGYSTERLHGGKPVFREGFTEMSRRFLHDEVSWEEADFRCLHLCFQARSSRDSTPTARRNIMETYGATRREGWMNRLKGFFQNKGESQWKSERYRRGPAVTVDAQEFFD